MAPVIVRGVDETDTLNVRREASARSAVVGTVKPDARGILATGRARRVGSSLWRQIEHAGVTGWVNARYLADDETAAARAPERGAASPGQPPRPPESTQAKDPPAPEPAPAQPPEPGPPPGQAWAKEPKEPKERPADGRRLSLDPPGLKEYPGEKEFNKCKKLPGGKAILKLNLKPETEINDLIGVMSSITCTPFLVPNHPTLQGKKVTVIATQRMSVAEAYRLFYAALDSVGLTVEPSGRFLRIIEAGKAHRAGLRYYGANDAIPADKRFITKLVRVDNLETNELVSSVLNRLKSDSGEIISYRSSLIITDTADNIQRMTRVVQDFDVPSPLAESLWMIRIKNLSATEMASRLAEVVGVAPGGPGGRRAGGGVGPPASSTMPAAMKVSAQWPGDLAAEMAIGKMVADERSNSLLVVANRRAYSWLITLVRKLDQPLDDGSGKNGNGRVHLYYCENANCDELAATLSAAAGVQVVGATPARRPRPAPGQPGLPALPPGPTGANAPGNPAVPMFDGDVRITFDAPTNSLLVVSSFKDFQALRKVIEKLDGPRKQVFIEAMILEVLLDKTRDVGVAYHGGKPLDLAGNEQSLLLGGFEASKTLSPASLLSNLGGLTGALFGPSIPAQNLQLFGTSVQLPSFGVFLQLLQTNNDVNVLSNPSLLITNNQEGEISVGENLPFPGQLAGGFPGAVPGQPPGGLGGFGGFPSVGVQRQNVALTMRITPSVNEHNMIRLNVDQVIEDVSAPNFNGLGPATSRRSAKTEVIARDQQTVVIGGLITDRVSETVKKVPILGDIPVLGFFFRSTSKTTKKANIIIALTPYVISDLADLRRVAEKKLRERREFIDRYSSLEDKGRLESDIDYRHKRGMLEEINRAAREAEEDEAELRRIRGAEESDPSTEIEPPGRTGPLRGMFSGPSLAQSSSGRRGPDAPAPGAPPVNSAPPPSAATPAPGAGPPPTD